MLNPSISFYCCALDRINELLKDSDSEISDGEDVKTKTKKKSKSQKSKKGAAWIKEGDGDIVDFMDSSVAKKLLGNGQQ